METLTSPTPQPAKKQSGRFALLALVLVIAAVSFFAGRLSAGDDGAPETQTVWRTTRYTFTHTTTEDAGGETLSTTVSEYDAQGKLLRSRTEDGDSIYENTYDERGSLAELLRYDAASGELTHREVWVYDENGNRLSFTEYDAAGEILGRSEYTYDEKGRETSSGYGSNGAPCEVSDTFEYIDAPDGGYTCIHRYCDSIDPSSDVTTTTVYDANGNVLRSESEYARGETYISEFEYAAFEVPVDQISKEDAP